MSLPKSNFYLAPTKPLPPSNRQAEKGYREVLRLRPDDPVAQRQLGIIYFDQGQLQQAYPLLKKSAELEPDNIDVQLKLAQAYFIGRDYQKARDVGAQIPRKKARASGGSSADGRHRHHT